MNAQANGRMHAQVDGNSCQHDMVNEHLHLQAMQVAEAVDNELTPESTALGT